MRLLLCIKFNDIQHSNDFIDKIKCTQTCILPKNASIRWCLELLSREKKTENPGDN